ncbi:glycosyltransferase [Oceanicoccus sp. KOV_DT_Chl]|uniref:glycosyltransferase n=1 Tax=Oceanicoccus sp. KOV_DT_Chl TaxID=1904639 RepID=UPI000C7B0575|nr:glycosyltransferase [Oceanicoccus sp. KOV_DT_Chl]
MVDRNLSDLKICHVVSGDLWGGAEAQVYGLIKGLNERVAVCAILFNYGKLYDRLTATGISVVVVDESNSGFLGLLMGMYKALKRIRPDIIHVHGFKENLIAGLASRGLGINVIRTHHGKGMLGVRKKYTYIERINARYLSDTLIAVSKDLLEYIVKCDVISNDAHVVRNGIKCDLKNHFDSKHARSDTNEVIIGTVGRLVPVKNHIFLINALSKMCEVNDKVKLIIVGDGPLLGELSMQAERLNISEKLIFTGFQDDVDKFLEMMDVFVLCSHHEGVPISLLEAMCFKIPVVCTRVGGIPEVIEDGVNGILVELGNVSALAGACLELIDNPVKARGLVDGAVATVTGDMSFESSLTQTLSLYKKYQ